MSEYMVWIWLTLLVLFVLIEIFTVQLTTVWLAGGALTALILAAFGVDNIIIQVVVFLAVSLILLVATRPLVKKFINSRSQPTNADRCIGEKAVVTEDIDNINAKGAVRINGIEWTARSKSGEYISKGTAVTVKKIDGVKLIVE